MTAVALDALLDQERELLLSGNIVAAHALIEQKESLLKHPIPDDDLARMRAKLERNGSLLQAAAEGIRRAQEQIAEIRTGASSAHVYGPDGARMQMQTRGRVNTRS